MKMYVSVVVGFGYVETPEIIFGISYKYTDLCIHKTNRVPCKKSRMFQRKKTRFLYTFIQNNTIHMEQP